MSQTLPFEDAKRMTRSVVAKQLNVSISTVRRWEYLGTLKPAVTRNGVRVFDEVEVNRIPIRKLKKKSIDRRTDGEVAALVFAMFDRGNDLNQIVQVLKLPPQVVIELYRFRMDGLAAAIR